MTTRACSLCSAVNPTVLLEVVLNGKRAWVCSGCVREMACGWNGDGK
jgi:hypothetical protein